MASRKRPCLKYQIQRCPAPCVLEVDSVMYAAQVRVVALFLDGRHDELIRELKARMQESSERLEFELAATYRDQLTAVESVREAQRIAVVTDRDQDVLGLYREGDLVELSLMVVRGGRVLDVGSFSNRRVEIPNDEVVAAFLREHYGEGGAGQALIPDEILLPMLPEGTAGVAEWLTEQREAAAKAAGERAPRRVEILAPARGPRRGLLDLATQNAEHSFKEKRRSDDDIEERLVRVQARLRLPTLPRRIECVDISHLGGSDTVGAVVALRDGVPDKKRYRTYHVHGVAEGDDYAAMYQVLSRRFRRGQRVAEAAEAAAGARRAQAEDSEQQAAALRLKYEAHAGSRDLEPSHVDPEELDSDDDHVIVVEELDTDELVAEDPNAEEIDATDVSDDDAGSVELTADTADQTEASRVESARSQAATAASKESEAWELPDLFVVDGGRGQLQVALTAAADLGLHDLSIVGLAKEKENVLGDKLVDRVYLPGQKNPIPLRPNSPELFILARARDEAHRFSNRGRKKLGKRRTFYSELDALPGIGKKTRTALLQRFGSLDAIRAASEAELLATPGVTRRQLRALRPEAPLPPVSVPEVPAAEETASEPPSS
jgi:excinuclease ABC subunit C